MSKFHRGEIVVFATGAVQYVKNIDRQTDFLLVTGRHGDIYIPVATIRKALEDEWRYEDTMRGKR